MKKTILITGSSGMLAQHFEKTYGKDYSIRFLTREVKKNNDFLWNVEQKYIDPKALEGVNIIIHLAGAGIADKPWTNKRKNTIIKSRVLTARLLLKTINKNNITQTVILIIIH